MVVCLSPRRPWVPSPLLRFRPAPAAPAFSFTKRVMAMCEGMSAHLVLMQVTLMLKSGSTFGASSDTASFIAW